MGDCQNYGAFLDPYCNMASSISGTKKGTIALTTPHINNAEMLCLLAQRCVAAAR